MLSHVEFGIPRTRGAARVPCSPGTAFNTVRSVEETQSSEISHGCPNLLVLHFYSATSAATELSQPQMESLELPKNSDRYFWLPEIVTTVALKRCCSRQQKYSTDLCMERLPFSKWQRKQIEKIAEGTLLLGTATVLLTL